MQKYYFSSLKEFAGMRDKIKKDLEQLCGYDVQLLFVALNEAVNNAIFHGHIDSSSPNVTVSLYKDGADICIVVRHDGIGYCAQECSPIDDTAEHGRGLEIINHCTDLCYYDETGNELVMRKTVG